MPEVTSSGMAAEEAVGLGCVSGERLGLANEFTECDFNALALRTTTTDDRDSDTNLHSNHPKYVSTPATDRTHHAANTNNPHSWSPSSAKMSTEAQTKKFQKGERVIPSATDKALKYYPAEDEQVMKKVRQHWHGSDGLDGMRSLDMGWES
jgi:hypothetical protein